MSMRSLVKMSMRLTSPVVVLSGAGQQAWAEEGRSPGSEQFLFIVGIAVAAWIIYKLTRTDAERYKEEAQRKRDEAAKAAAQLLTAIDAVTAKALLEKTQSAAKASAAAAAKSNAASSEDNAAALKAAARAAMSAAAAPIATEAAAEAATIVATASAEYAVRWGGT